MVGIALIRVFEVLIIANNRDGTIRLAVGSWIGARGSTMEQRMAGCQLMLLTLPACQERDVPVY